MDNKYSYLYKKLYIKINSSIKLISNNIISLALFDSTEKFLFAIITFFDYLPKTIKNKALVLANTLRNSNVILNSKNDEEYYNNICLELDEIIIILSCGTRKQ